MRTTLTRIKLFGAVLALALLIFCTNSNRAQQRASPDAPISDSLSPDAPIDITHATVTDAADGRRVVDELKNAGADFIKIQSLVPADGYFAAAAEAGKLGITFVGHVPDKVRAVDASNAGQKSIEHLTGVFEACSTVEDE